MIGKLDATRINKNKKCADNTKENKIMIQVIFYQSYIIILSNITFLYIGIFFKSTKWVSDTSCKIWISLITNQTVFYSFDIWKIIFFFLHEEKTHIIKFFINIIFLSDLNFIYFIFNFCYYIFLESERRNLLWSSF